MGRKLPHVLCCSSAGSVVLGLSVLAVGCDMTALFAGLRAGQGVRGMLSALFVFEKTPRGAPRFRPPFFFFIKRPADGANAAVGAYLRVLAANSSVLTSG